MKNTTFRKKALLSSVAMLLVALVALGSATFAWFTASSTAYADGINVETTKMSNLEISSKNVGWGTHVDYEVDNAILFPASTVDGSQWWAAEAAADNNYEAIETADNVTKTFTNTQNVCDYYFADQLNIKNAGTADCKNVTIKIQNFTDTEYARIAIVPVTSKGGSTIVGSVEDDTITFKNFVYADDTVSYNGVKDTPIYNVEKDGEGNVTSKILNTNAIEAITPKVAGDIEVAETLKPGDELYFNVYVWFEGNDEQCTARNAGEKLPTLKLTVTGAKAQ